jgi:RNA polymerase sigma factor (sigma-70 family)
MKVRPVLVTRNDTGDSTTESRCLDPIAEDPSPSQMVRNEETMEKVRAVLHGLPALEREIVQLRIWEQMSYLEIGQRLGRDESTVRYHFHRALECLRPPMKEL